MSSDKTLNKTWPRAMGLMACRRAAGAGRRSLRLLTLALASVSAFPQQPNPTAVTQSFITVNAPVVVLRNVRVIDGAGAPAAENQTIVIADGKIRAIGPEGSTPVPAGAQAIDLAG